MDRREKDEQLKRLEKAQRAAELRRLEQARKQDEQYVLNEVRRRKVEEVRRWDLQQRMKADRQRHQYILVDRDMKSALSLDNGSFRDLFQGAKVFSVDAAVTPRAKSTLGFYAAEGHSSKSRKKEGKVVFVSPTRRQHYAPRFVEILEDDDEEDEGKDGDQLLRPSSANAGSFRQLPLETFDLASVFKRSEKKLKRLENFGEQPSLEDVGSALHDFMHDRKRDSEESPKKVETVEGDEDLKGGSRWM